MASGGRHGGHQKGNGPVAKSRREEEKEADSL
jgi:hypothetical protein